jgi:hypothetical protein
MELIPVVDADSPTAAQCFADAMRLAAARAILEDGEDIDFAEVDAKADAIGEQLMGKIQGR